MERCQLVLQPWWASVSVIVRSLRLAVERALMFGSQTTLMMAPVEVVVAVAGVCFSMVA